jgi:hypothetical protein
MISSPLPSVILSMGSKDLKKIIGKNLMFTLANSVVACHHLAVRHLMLVKNDSIVRFGKPPSVFSYNQ